ncbi:hypothetical protein ACP70R_037553 [Stipagrostis hirtigluma subsp. patula]
MAKMKTIFSYYKKQEPSIDVAQEIELVPQSNAQDIPQLIEPISDPIPQADSRAQVPQVDSSTQLNSGVGDFVKGDPGLRPQIQNCPVDKQNEIRMAYMKLGPYQPKKDVYPSSGPNRHRRRFQSHWFNAFSWLEYSPSKDAAFCFPCFLFRKKPKGKSGSNTFTEKGFRSWRKVNNGKECAFLSHMGKDSNSAHNFAAQCYDNLKSGKYDIEQVMEKVSDEDIIKNRLRLKTSIDAAKWLAFQSCPFRGNDEGPNSMNQGNFLEMMKLPASYNAKVKAVVRQNPEFQNLPTIAALCRKLAESGRSKDYHLVDRLIRLILTLPVSTATTERAFSAMKLVKTRLRNKMEDEYLRDCLLTYIEKEMALEFTVDTIIDDFNVKKRRRVELQ